MVFCLFAISVTRNYTYAMEDFWQRVQEYVDNELPSIVEWFLWSEKIQDWASSEVYKIFTDTWMMIFKAVDTLDIIWEVEMMKKWKWKWIEAPEIIDWWHLDWLDGWSGYLMEFIDEERTEKLKVSTDFDDITYHESLWKILKNMHWEAVEWYWEILYHDWEFRWKYSSYDEYFSKKYWLHRVNNCLNLLELDHNDYNKKFRRVIESWRNNDMVICHFDLYSHNTFWESELTVIDPNLIAENPEMDIARTIAHIITKDDITNIDTLLSWYWWTLDKDMLLDMVYIRQIKTFAYKLHSWETIEEVKKQYSEFDKWYSLLREKWWIVD